MNSVLKPLFSALLAVVGVIPAGAWSQESVFTELLWESSEASTAGIQVQITNLYDTLYELRQGGAQLQTRKTILVNESGASILDLLKREQLYVGSGENFPHSLYLLLCELNADKCTMRESRSGEPSAQWNKVADVEIVIPDLRLEPVPQVQSYNKKRGDRISTIVVKERRGCEIFDAQCEARVRHLNPTGTKLEPSYEGVILVPSMGYGARVPLVTSASKDIAQGAIVSKYGVSEESAKRFIDNVMATPASAVQLYTTHSEKTVIGKTYLAEVLQIIRYRPQENSRDRRLTIGLVDSSPDLHHCALDLRVIVERNKVLEIDGTSSRPWTWPRDEVAINSCGGMSNLPVSDEEHGTHLLGLWFSAKASPVGAGMLPRGDDVVFAFGAIHHAKITVQPAHYTHIGSILNIMAQQVSVINLSWGLSTSVALADQAPFMPRTDTDSIGVAIKKYVKEKTDIPVIFVAAAGNDNRNLDIGTCDITPACAPEERRNVLTVAALTNDKDDPDVVSNFGRKVHIGVPAVNLVSTLRQHMIGSDSGSSQATAIASAALAMLAYSTGLKPEQALTRLIYTSDLTPKLQEGDGKLFGGRLNYERASKINSVHLDCNGVEKLVNKISIGNNNPYVHIIPSPEIYHPIGDFKNNTLRIHVNNIRRLVRKHGTDADRTHTIFYIENGKIERIDGVLVRESENIDVTTSSDFSCDKLKDIRDYTARVPENNN
ncbi:S8 family serine peptidase [Thauera sp. SDU_THAU2]|uniref:S8 family serine peptidase n=1 Tax=Thauera sp. SDU_THAU2 TaxID=3136633 RepID=UPI0031200DD7